MWKLFYMVKGNASPWVWEQDWREGEKLTFGVLEIVNIKLHNMANEHVCILIDL